MKTCTPLKELFAVIGACLFFGASAQAPHSDDYHKSTSSARVNSTSGTGQNIDVIYQRCDWTINPPVAKTITGTVTITFKTTQASVSAISLDLNKASFNNGSLTVKYLGNNVPFSFPTTGNVNILNITLPSALALNTTASIVITYSGNPPAVNGQAEGYQRKQDAAGNWYIYTLSESYEDKDWWPCKADMQDKIDAMDINLTVPNGYRGVTNGAFIDSNTVAGGMRTFRWQTRYPVATYLVGIGVAKYYVFDRGPVSVSGTNVPVWHLMFPDKSLATYNTYNTALDKAKLELASFGAKFGDYPFKNEKHGYYEFGWGGGLEHQSMSSMGGTTLNSWSVIAHELAHQWWGDKVTFATWNHLWLAEGFAKYSEALAAELVPSLSQNPITHRSNMKSTALATTGTPVYLSNASIANSNTLWTTNNDNAIYQRGAMVVSMLRKLCGDAKFFQACKNYLEDPALAYGSATTADLQAHFEAVLGGFNLTPFFTDWVYGTGNPDYLVNWGNNGKRINIELTSQTRSAGSTVPYFRSPVVLKIRGTGVDTTVVIYDANGSVAYAGNGIQATRSGNRLAYVLSFVPTSVQVDPDAETMVVAENATFNAALNNVALVLLDVDILDFTGTTKNSSNELSLVLAPTSEKVAVTLERGVNGLNFTAIGNMLPGIQNATQAVFSYHDRNAAPGQDHHYRAKVVTQKGEVTYSKVVALSGKRYADIKLMPVPAHEYISVALSPEWKEQSVNITLYNSAGAIVERDVFLPGATIKLPVKHFPAGAYSLKMEGTGGKQVVRSFSVVH